MNYELFAYGSLMRGLGNHHYLQRSKMLRIARTTASFTLVDLGAFPGLVAAGVTAVRGEVYAIDDVALAAIDRLEGHPRFYRRQEIGLSDGTRVLAYLLPRERYARYPAVVGGDWREHLANERAVDN